MADTKPALPSRPVTFSSSGSPDPPSTSTARQRGPQRQPSGQNLNGSLSPPPPKLDRRRSSILSYSSLDGVAHSLAEDLINPSTSARNLRDDDYEVTHWHSTPLAFAILPAVAGLLFKNGSAFVTDVLLLGLAAIFMNWSIRLPWDWYYSAQMQIRMGSGGPPTHDTLEEADDVAVESSSSAGNSPSHHADGQPDAELAETSRPSLNAEDAAAELRRQEKLALLSTFVFPVLAAYLIHVIRGQLSAPSTGLVSDFNLSVFLLAAEIRPCRQLIRLITSRTLHLQRTVTGLHDPFSAAAEGKDQISTLASRIADLEAKLSDHTLVPQSTSLAQKHDVTDLSAEMRKRYEPRLEGLERGMRRYEKRAATMTMQIEQRFGQMDAALQDTLSLAAQAARQSQNRGVGANVLEGASTVITFPMKIAWGLVMWPMRVVDDAYAKLRTILVGPLPPKVRKTAGSRQGPLRDEKGKTLIKKPAR